MCSIAQLFRSLLPIWIAISAAFTVAASSAASNDKTFDAALIEYLEHGSNAEPEQTAATQATTNTVKAIENLLSEESREEVRHRCLETLTSCDLTMPTQHSRLEIPCCREPKQEKTTLSKSSPDSIATPSRY